MTKTLAPRSALAWIRRLEAVADRLYGKATGDLTSAELDRCIDITEGEDV